MPNGKDRVQLCFFTSEWIRDRLKDQAKRLGVDMNTIIREGTLQRLEELEEQEALYEARKRVKKQRGSIVPDVVQHPWGAPPGLGMRNVPKRLQRSFRRWAEHLDGATTPEDGKVRVQTILTDMRERAVSKEEADACYAEFQKFMGARADARMTPVDVAELVGVTPGGDVDED